LTYQYLEIKRGRVPKRFNLECSVSQNAERRTYFGMRVLLYLYYPFFDSQLAGGMQVWLRKLVAKMTEKYPQIKLRILCPRSDLHPFPDIPDLYPVLDDLETEYLTVDTAYKNLSIIQRFVNDADVIWLIDRVLPVQTGIPKLLSLTTICYEREVMAFFSEQWDRASVPSDFAKNAVSRYGRRPDFIRKIPLFRDESFFPQTTEEVMKLRRYFSYDPSYRYILFPHRPDPLKGHTEAIDVLKKLVRADKKFRMLIPKPPVSRVADSESETAFVCEIEKSVHENHLDDHVIFHDWIPYKDLPLMFSCGEVTLFLSRLPETFGQSLASSIACGTPVISYGKGALTETVPSGYGHQVVGTGNTNLISDIILSGKAAEGIEKGMEQVRRANGLDTVAEAYMKLLAETATLAGL